MKNLIIVESPTKAKTLARFLGEDYEIQATMGHLRDLPERKIGIKTDDNFTPEYVIMPDKKETADLIKKLSAKAGNIFLATDPDREGEAIAYHVSVICSNSKLKNQKSKFSRIVFHEITQSAIKHALEKPREIDMNLVNAQQARRILDRLVGYKLSPLLWFKIRKGLSAGRVQSVAVRLIVEREREIEKFVPIEYWEIFANLKKHLGGSMPDVAIFSARLISENGQKCEIKNQEQADLIVTQLNSSGYEIQNVEKKEARRSSIPPFTTSTLQQQGANRLGWPAKRTMRTAQSLYEKGLITYHRTDSTNIAEEAIVACRSFIEKEYGKAYLPEAPKIYKTKSKVAQEAHEAIRPTNLELRGQDIESKEEGILYELIWKRFVACQMADAIFDETKLSVLATSETNHYLLETLGRTIKFAGFLTLYGKEEARLDSVEPRRGDEDGETQLPDLVTGDELDLVKIDPLQKFTQPPPRFNEASLIKTLEEFGIGRPSTYAPIISTIQERMYVEKTDNKFYPTPLGNAVNDFIFEYFPEIVDYKFTAHMEDDLDDIANGKQEWVPVIKEFFDPFNAKLTSVSKIAERVPVETEVTDEICPDCGAPLVVRIGRFGKFLSCSKFPDCKFTKPYLKDAGFKCEKCGSPMLMKRTKKGKTFYGCSTWPKCDYATWRKPTIAKQNENPA